MTANARDAHHSLVENTDRALGFIPIALLGLLTLLLFTGCATNNVYNDLVAYPLNSVQANYTKGGLKKASKLRLGIAFGGGGVRGFMHLGVIKALEENNIKADIVTGSSAGSIIAAAYASGMGYAQINHITENLKVGQITDFVLSYRGVLQGKEIAQWVNERVGNPLNQSRIEKMALRLGLVVTNVSTQQALLVTQGNIGQAVQASSSIPGAFIPVTVKGKTWVDGGVLTLVPVNFTRAMGADVVIGVDVYCGNFASRLERSKNKDGIRTLLYFISRLQTCALNKPEFESADITISPSFEPEKMISFASKKQAVEAGYQSTLKRIPQIKALLASPVPK